MFFFQSILFLLPISFVHILEGKSNVIFMSLAHTFVHVRIYKLNLSINETPMAVLLDYTALIGGFGTGVLLSLRPPIIHAAKPSHASLSHTMASSHNLHAVPRT